MLRRTHSRGSAKMADVADGEFRLVRAERSENVGWADRFHYAMRKEAQAT